MLRTTSLTAHHDATYSIVGLNNETQPRDKVCLIVHKADGTEDSFSIDRRLDTPVEIDYYRAVALICSSLNP